MIKNGTKPTKIDHRDYDFHKSFGALNLKAIPFPQEYNTDAGVTMPNQEIDDYSFTPFVPAELSGCTNESTSDVATDLSNGSKIRRPDVVEAITHANALGGYDVRQSLLTGLQPNPLNPKRLGWYSAIFNIRAIGQDFFDAIRDAMASGGTERRSVSIGTPWYPEFEPVGNGNGKMTLSGIISEPANWSTDGMPWHNWKICGWKMIDGQVYLIGKSWQGAQYGDKGFCYFNRQIINHLMSIPGTVAFTATTGALPPISTVNTTWLQWIISYARSLLPYS